jgi:hypothetical protein
LLTALTSVLKVDIAVGIVYPSTSLALTTYQSVGASNPLACCLDIEIFCDFKPLITTCTPSCNTGSPSSSTALTSSNCLGVAVPK